MRDAPPPGVVSGVVMCGETWRNGYKVAPARCEIAIEGSIASLWYDGPGGLWGALDWADQRGLNTVPYRMYREMVELATRDGAFL